MNRSLSIPEWHNMALKGIAPPVRILLNGGSMFPLIRWNKDYVTIVPLKEAPDVGDIVLFTGPDNDKYVMHRVWEVKDGMVLTWGDNCPNPDGWFPLEYVWGKTILIERGQRKLKPNPRKGIKWAEFWHHARKGYLFYRRIKDGVARRIKRKLS